MEPYQLRRGSFRNLTLRVASDGVVKVSAPWFVPRPLVDRFVGQREAWIAERRRALAARPEADASVRWVWGVPLPVATRVAGRRARVVWAPGDDRITVEAPEGFDPSRLSPLLDAWDKARVAQALETLVPLWEARTGQRVAAWTVKTLRSRWGSCRPDRRTLVLNGRLGAYAPACLEHVLVHEMAHLVIPHHGPTFHALVESWLPGAQMINRILKAGPSASAVLVASPAPVPTPEAGTEPATPR